METTENIITDDNNKTTSNAELDMMIGRSIKRILLIGMYGFVCVSDFVIPILFYLTITIMASTGFVHAYGGVFPAIDEEHAMGFIRCYYWAMCGLIWMMFRHIGAVEFVKNLLNPNKE